VEPTSTSLRPRDYGIAPPKFRLPEATHVGSVTLEISNLDRSLAYYRDVLGLHVIDADVETAVLGTDEGQVLVKLHQDRRVRPVPRGGLLGLFHFAILLPTREDLGRFIRHVTALDLTCGSADHLVSEATYLWDPDGLGIEVYADRPHATWQTEDRQLVMATEPLDLRSLIEAAGPARWANMPRATTMGHVHLSVGDLAEARAFYHAGLGFDLTVWSYPGALFMSAGGYHHHLGTNTWSAGARPATTGDARLLEWELVVPTTDDVAAASASLRAAGSDAPVTQNDAVARDPWGIAVRVTPARGSGCAS
jgi:catechol 2,3-dioxygenase